MLIKGKKRAIPFIFLSAALAGSGAYTLPKRGLYHKMLLVKNRLKNLKAELKVNSKKTERKKEELIFSAGDASL